MSKILSVYKKKRKLFCWLGVIVVIGLFSLLLCNKGFPTAEGWYSYYSKCIIDGDIVYKDFEYLFTPLYMYLLTSIIQVFGYNIIVLRIFGVLVYLILASICYLILSELFSAESSAIGAIIGIFYLQSEVYTVFYDYVRIMDIFSFLSILFMLKSVKQWINGKTPRFYPILWGIFSILFAFVKQNMGGLFCVFSVLLIIYCGIYFRWNKNKFFLNLFNYIMSMIIPAILIIGIIFICGIWDDFIQAVFFGAVEAKGGLFSILFNWIINGFPGFGKAFLWSLIILLLIYFNIILSKYYPEEKHKISSNSFCFISFILICLIGIPFIMTNKEKGIYFSLQKQFDVNILFDLTVLALCICFFYTIRDWKKRKKTYKHLALHLSLFGAYFTLCYGAGMSGGLSIGESAIAMGFLFPLFTSSIKHKFAIITKSLSVIFAIFLSFTCIGYKMINPCSWWGITESNIYDCTEYSNIPILKGILLFNETKKMYEGIVDAVQENTTQNDTIYCFPHIPIFYLLCDRNDPGIFSKVQWFDVCTNASVSNDIQIIEQELPSAIIIYNLNEAVYTGHETSFNNSTESSTRQMRSALYRIVNTYNYEYAGTFTSTSNNISVYTRRSKEVNLKKYFPNGSGTPDDPYLISNSTELVHLSMLVNQGINFRSIYFSQTNDINLEGIVWIPIGEYGTFQGSYENNSFEITNINSGTINSSNDFSNNLWK